MPEEPPAKNPTGFLSQLAMAMELPFVLVGGVVIGGAIGYFLDQKLHTGPWLLLAFGLLGFAGGLRELLRRLSRGEGRGSPDGKSNDG
jgi:ATP synthase protein I